MIKLLKDNEVDYIYSEDSDLIAHGCLNIVKGLRRNKKI